MTLQQLKYVTTIANIGRLVKLPRDYLYLNLALQRPLKN